MTQRNLLLSLSMLAGGYALAAQSPYAGSPAAEGSFYLYQVETGKWLQANCSKLDQWTTHAELGEVGFDIELRKPDGFNDGFQIFCNFKNNGELNGSDEDRFFLDQENRQLTEWIFLPVDGAPGQYKIMVKARPEGPNGGRDYIAQDHYIGYREGDYGGLSDDPTDFTWQLVSREERLKVMQEDAEKNGSADASWLIPWWDRGRNDNRASSWSVTDQNPSGGGTGHDGSQGYPVIERWHNIIHNAQITLTDLPAGSYSFSVQAFYRDTEVESEALKERRLNGTENLRAKYFCGPSEGTVMSIFANAREQADPDAGYDWINEQGVAVPNSMDAASKAMIRGDYVNDYITAPVGEDGRLTIGIKKESADYRDWLIYKRMYLRYDGNAVDLSVLCSQLDDLIAEAENIHQTPAIARVLLVAKNVDRTNASALAEALNLLVDAINGVKGASDDVKHYLATRDLCDAADILPAEELFNNAVNADHYKAALKELRYNRRRAAAEKHADVFEGQKATEGEFYLYNVGQKQFLCGGSDWGAHAALGFPGVLVTLEGDGDTFAIETGLFNGDSHHLNFSGYMDAAADRWTFIDAGNGAYNIVHGSNLGLVWNPDARVDAGQSDETTVGAEDVIDFSNPDAQWKLVSRAEREALLENASASNPVDASFFIMSPNFSKREKPAEHWIMQNASVWDEGGNHYDFSAESFNTESCDIHQTVEGLPVGWYRVSVQGFYRNGHQSLQADNEDLKNAILYAGDQNLGTYVEIPLVNINEETGNAPGEGTTFVGEGRTVEVPDGIVQATNFFKSGLYRNEILVEVKNPNNQPSERAASSSTGSLPIGVKKMQKGEDSDWLVADNFRLSYVGDNNTVGIEEIQDAEYAPAADSRIYNLQGIEVKNPSVPGIYIRNGKKFTVK